MNRSLLLLSALSLALLPGCKKKPIDDGMADASGGEPAPVTAAKPSEAPAHVQEMAANFARVYFDFDSAVLNGESKRALDANVDIMGKYTDVKVEVQGHADERGTTDYNLALGQQRAAAVADYLTGQGVAASRLPIVSYGEERPAVPGMSETAWAQNRRAEFRILAGDEVKGTVQ